MKRLLPVILCTAAYLAVASATAVHRQSSEFVIYIGVVVLLMGLVGWLDRRYALPTTVLWLLSLWGLLHMAGGLVRIPTTWPYHSDSPVLYNWWLIPEYFKYDQLVHAYGFGTTTWVVWVIMRQAFARSLDVPPEQVRLTGGKALTCAVTSMGFGAVNEIVEFTAVLLLPETNVGGYMNTGWDLVFNALGALIAAGILWTNSKFIA